MNVSTVKTAVLALALAAGISACNQNKTADKPAAAASTPTTSASSAAPEIVFVSQDSIAAKSEYYNDMTKKLEEKNKSVQAEVGSKQQALQRQYAEAQKNAATMSADQRSTTEQRLQRDAQSFQQYQQSAGAQLQNEAVSENTKFYDKLADFTKTYAKEKGYKMVLTFTKGNTTMLYGDPSLDVTSDFIKRFNETYKK